MRERSVLSVQRGPSPGAEASQNVLANASAPPAVSPSALGSTAAHQTNHADRQRAFVKLQVKDDIWTFEAPRLPAIDLRAGHVAVGDKGDDRFATRVELSIRLLSLGPGGTRVESTDKILEFEAYDKLSSLTDTSARLSALEQLERNTREVLDRANARLESEGFVAMTPCEVSDPSDDSAPCMRPQTIQCGAFKATYHRGKLRWGNRSITAKQWQTERWSAKTVYERSGQHGVSAELVTCVREAYRSEEGRILATLVFHTCNMAGDWCSAPPEWVIAKVE